MSLLPTAEQVLINIPIILLYWSALSIAWGSYVLHTRLSYIQLDRITQPKKQSSIYNAVFLAITITILVSCMLFQPLIANHVDVLFVANIFFTSYLTYSFIFVKSYWREKSRADQTTLLTF